MGNSTKMDRDAYTPEQGNVCARRLLGTLLARSTRNSIKINEMRACAYGAPIRTCNRWPIFSCVCTVHVAFVVLDVLMVIEPSAYIFFFSFLRFSTALLVSDNTLVFAFLFRFIRFDIRLNVLHTNVVHHTRTRYAS